MLSQSDITKIQQYLTTQPVSRAYLFGSVARNEETTASDIDLLVELERDAKVGLVKFASIKLDLEKILSKKIDLLSVGGVSDYLMPIIEREKRLVYEK